MTSDRIPVSAADLAAALTEFRLDVRDARDAMRPGESTATISYPEIVGRVLHDTLAAHAAHRDPPPEDKALAVADPELAAIATAVAHLEPLDGEAQRRVLRYLAERYGIED